MTEVINVQSGKKCPSCGAEGKYNGEHETAVRVIEVGRVKPEMIKRNIVDVGWRCWNCGHEWGFEVKQEGTGREPEVPVL